MMKKLNKQTGFIFFFLIMFGWPSFGSGDTYSTVPQKFQAGLFLKILGFDKDMSGKAISIYVVNSPEFAAEVRKAIGKKIGKSKLVAVDEGTGLPAQKPSVIYIGNSTNLGEIINYARSNKVLSITGMPELVAKGVTLGVGALAGKPKILLNISASKAEDVNWSPAIFKISTILKE